MERRKLLKILTGTGATLAGIGVAGYYTLDRIFNPKTPLSYNYPDLPINTQTLLPTPECKGRSHTTIAQTEGPFYSPQTPLRT